MTSPVFDAQPHPAVEPGTPAAQLEFDVYTPPFTPQQPVPAPVAPVPPPKPKKTGIVVLSLFVVLLFGAGAAFGVLFFQEKGRSADLSRQVEGKDREIADLTKKAKDSKEDTDRAVAAQKKAEADAAGSQKCRDAAKALTESLVANDRNKGQTAIGDLLVQC
ncbi:hypothetical protein SAMN04488564_105179 [Lentzea waywayandensis]|uniref:Uncharacterized protein n=1 Tax=Lentzea waywayandensis TaxID=84724 RepID=A0A1I6ES00_9PSEU|nr:hypothetical protein [Lentzea waywayandensis]SFR20278.1 hypothetical protein SAMN04488564_105179 [Lentzea waywayandensis]